MVCSSVCRSTFVYTPSVVYVDEWTTDFTATLEALLHANQAVAYIAVERRINFTIEDLAPTCQVTPELAGGEKCSGLNQLLIVSLPKAYRHFEQVCLHSERLTVEPCATDQLPRLFGYERTPQLELWKVYRRFGRF